jgi:8-oxo-dGTP diphosphatase
MPSEPGGYQDRESPYEIPRIPASAGALVFDADGRLLILKPVYKSGWTIPGGQVEADGESPWEACKRETLEESGLRVETGRLACIDFLRPRGHRPGGARFLFDCGAFEAESLRGLEVQAGEIAEFRFVPLAEALELLSGPLRRRVAAATGGKRCVYLEDGRPVGGVST